MDHRVKPRDWHGLIRVLILLFFCAPAAAQTYRWGGSIRAYQFARTSTLPGETRRDTELGILRLTSAISLSPRLHVETHGVLSVLSPPFVGAAGIATAAGTPWLPLQDRLLTDPRAEISASFDRLNLQFDLGKARVTAGRQAVTWGVTYFWPAMDLFSPFGPERIDRDYKPGVDAVRVIVPLGAFSEFEVMGGSLGPSPGRDWAAGALVRIHLGRADLGLMGGKFHRDAVGGVFVSADVRGTGVRAEATLTHSGDPEDRARDRRRFWRASGGVDRQLTPDWTLTAELSWNDYGTSRASEYLALIDADRIRRGEVNALGRFYSGAAASWRFHPLWTLSNALLVNANDPSALWIPSLAWSTGNNSELLLGAQVGWGGEIAPAGIPRSEYGSVPTTFFLGFKTYF